MTPPRVIALAALLSALACSSVQAQQQRTQVQRTQEAQSTKAASSIYGTLSERDRLLAQIWDLDEEEMLRAKVLLEGPRKSFSVENLSPVEALGIHARNDAERRKYAEKFARAFRADVERSLAWNQAFTEAMQRLYPNDPVVDSAGLPATVAPVGAADALGVPRGLVFEPAANRAPAATQKAGARR